MVVRFRKKKSIKHENFLVIVGELLWFLDQDYLERVAVVPQCVWFRRNVVVHGRLVGPQHNVVSQALENLAAF